MCVTCWSIYIFLKLVSYFPFSANAVYFFPMWFRLSLNMSSHFFLENIIVQRKVKESVNVLVRDFNNHFPLLCISFNLVVMSFETSLMLKLNVYFFCFLQRCAKLLFCSCINTNNELSSFVEVNSKCFFCNINCPIRWIKFSLA